jgi:hypothetical protein
MASDPPPEDEDEDIQVDVDALVPPWSIWYAVRLMWAGAVLSLAVLPVTFLTEDSIKRSIADQLREQNNYSQHTLDVQYQTLVASAVVVSLLGAVMWLWMARVNGAGKKWARLLATGLGVTNIVGFAASLTADGVTVPQIVLDGLGVLLAAAVLLLLWHPDSGDYYWFKSKRA